MKIRGISGLHIPVDFVIETSRQIHLAEASLPHPDQWHEPEIRLCILKMRDNVIQGIAINLYYRKVIRGTEFEWEFFEYDLPEENSKGFFNF